MTEFDHLYCEGCEYNPSYALRDGEGVLVCHCTGTGPGDDDPVAIHGFDDLPEQWSFDDADGIDPDRSLGDYDRIEREVGEWAERNFGAEQPDWYPLVGAAEELGEIAQYYDVDDYGRMSGLLMLLDNVGRLVHSELKMAQGIRESDPSVGKEQSRTFAEKIANAAIAISDVDGVGSASLPDCTDVHEEVADGLGDTHVYLADYSYRNPLGLSLADCVELAWYDEVIDRDWDADVDVGGGET